MSGAARMLGRVVAEKYRLTSVIGEGGMATVFCAEQDAEPRDVAVKILHPHLVDDRTFLKRFHREAKAAAQIRHPSSVRVIDYGVEGRTAYIVMERLLGKDLFDVLALERRLSETRAARIMIEIADALSAAHALGIIHRDLKPENVMLWRHPNDPSVERVKVLDFGIAKILDDEAQPPPSTDDAPMSSDRSTALTTVGMLVGTPAYMSPEQCLARDIDGRTDVYAAGVLLYQLVTGRLPFLGETLLDIGPQHIETPPPPPSRFVPAITPALEACILRALAKKPADRHQTAAELGDELERIMPTLATEPHAPPVSVRRRASGELEAAPVSQRALIVASPITMPSPQSVPEAAVAAAIAARHHTGRSVTLPAPAVAKDDATAASPATERRAARRPVQPIVVMVAVALSVALVITLASVLLPR